MTIPIRRPSLTRTLLVRIRSDKDHILYPHEPVLIRARQLFPPQMALAQILSFNVVRGWWSRISLHILGRDAESAGLVLLNRTNRPVVVKRNRELAKGCILVSLALGNCRSEPVPGKWSPRGARDNLSVENACASAPQSGGSRPDTPKSHKLETVSSVRNKTRRPRTNPYAR